VVWEERGRETSPYPDWSHEYEKRILAYLYPRSVLWVLDSRVQYGVPSLWSFCSQSVLKYRRIIQERKQIVQILDGFLESEKFGKVVQL
jgi:hypothetical protein